MSVFSKFTCLRHLCCSSGEVGSSLFNITMALSVQRTGVLCPFHGGHRHLGSAYNGPNDDFYMRHKIFADGWGKERLANSLCESQITYVHPPLKEAFEWFYNNVGDLTSTPYVKEAFANVVFIRHKSTSQTSNLQVGCRVCRRMSPPLFYASENERYQKMAHMVFWEFLQPYRDEARREGFWEQFYREQASAASTSSTEASTRSPSVTSSPPSEQPLPEQPPVEQHPPQQQPPGPKEYDCYWENLRRVPSVLPPEPHLSLSARAPEPSALPYHPWVHSSSSESSED